MRSSIDASPRTGGFTLLEVLVSMTVLAILLVLVTQLLDDAALAIGGSGKHLDTDTEARLLFNRMAVDIARAVKRPDVDYSSLKEPASKLGSQYGNATFPDNSQTGGNDRLAFFSAADGYFSGSATSQPTGIQKAPVSLVAYMVTETDPYNAGPVFQRLGKGLGWEPSSSLGMDSMVYLPLTIAGPAPNGQWPNLFAGDQDFKTVGSQVLRFEYTYLLKPTTTLPARLSVTPWDTTATLNPLHTCINGFQDVAAIVVAVAVLDSASRLLVGNYSKLIDNTVFSDAKDAANDTIYGGDIAAAWNAAVINSRSFATKAGIPVRAAEGVRVYERYFYLDTQR